MAHIITILWTNGFTLFAFRWFCTLSVDWPSTTRYEFPSGVQIGQKFLIFHLYSNQILGRNFWVRSKYRSRHFLGCLYLLHDAAHVRRVHNRQCFPHRSLLLCSTSHSKRRRRNVQPLACSSHFRLDRAIHRPRRLWRTQAGAYGQSSSR